MLAHVIPIFRYAENAARLIRAYKMEGRTSLAAYFVKVLSETLPIVIGANEQRSASTGGFCIVPVPARPEKIRKGGFDQTGHLARQLAEKGFSLWTGLERCTNIEQKSLTRSQRFENAQRSFVLGAHAHQLPARVVLLDDVLTTGATLNACASILAHAGVIVEGALVLAAD